MERHIRSRGSLQCLNDRGYCQDDTTAEKHEFLTHEETAGCCRKYG